MDSDNTMGRKRLRFHLAVLVFVAASTANGQVTTRVNVDSSGVPSSASAFAPISADGRFVLFLSPHPWYPTPTPDAGQAYVHDRWTGITERVSRAVDGGPTADPVGALSVSADARFAAFQSWGDDLVVGDVNGFFDVFVYDRSTRTTVLASLSASGTQGNSDSDLPMISPCGRYVAFRSRASNLVPGDTNGFMDLFVKDLVTGSIERVNVTSSGQQAIYGPPNWEGEIWTHAMSLGGRYVVFDSYATNLAPGLHPGTKNAFLRDRLTRQTILLSADVQGNAGDYDSGQPNISADGRYVTFASMATNLAPGDTNLQADVFLRDLRAGTIARISLGPGGMEGNGSSVWPVISADGTKVLFLTFATNFFPNAPMYQRLILYDRASGTIELAGLTTAGEVVKGAYGHYDLSADGSIISFDSIAKNVVPGGILGYSHTYVRDTTLSCPPMYGYCTAKWNSAGCQAVISVAGIPTLTGYDTFFVTAERVLNNQPGFFFWGLASQNIPFGGAGWGGRLCVRPPFVRTAVQRSGGFPPSAGSDCSGYFTFPFDQAYMASRGLTAGTTVYGQYWYRDPGYPVPRNFSLTGGLEFTICN